MNKEVKDSVEKLKAEVNKFNEDVKKAAKEGRVTKDLEAGNEKIKKQLDELEQKLKSERKKLPARKKKSK